jgi:hypothetical protein
MRETAVSEAGANPALSRNCDALPGGSRRPAKGEPGRLAAVREIALSRKGVSQAGRIQLIQALSAD